MHESAGSPPLPLDESAKPPTASASTAELVTRPKVMRRPATFSTPSGASQLPFELLKIAPVVEHIATPQQRPWQDDSRFGMALLGIVLVINLLLAIAIPAPHRDTVAFTEKAVSTNDSGNFMPAPTSGEHAPITIYAQPEDGRRSTQFFDLRQIPPSQNSLSVSPKDIPAPTAQALDQQPVNGQ